MNRETAEQVYDILVEEGGAREGDRGWFLYGLQNGFSVWNFGGIFGSSGRLDLEEMRVKYFLRGGSVELKSRLDILNQRLALVVGRE